MCLTLHPVAVSLLHSLIFCHQPDHPSRAVPVTYSFCFLARADVVNRGCGAGGNAEDSPGSPVAPLSWRGDLSEVHHGTGQGASLPHRTRVRPCRGEVWSQRASGELVNGLRCGGISRCPRGSPALVWAPWDPGPPHAPGLPTALPPCPQGFLPSHPLRGGRFQRMIPKKQKKSVTIDDRRQAALRKPKGNLPPVVQIPCPNTSTAAHSHRAPASPHSAYRRAGTSRPVLPSRAAADTGVLPASED